MTSPLPYERWQPPAGWLAITTLDMHTGGEPLRVVTGGLPPLEGRTVLDKRRFFREHHDHIRTGLMLEPRGHADMYGAIVTTLQDADFDVFFIHNEGYSTMCGHAVIALTTLAYEVGLVGVAGAHTRLTINVPAGTVEAHAIVRDGRLIEARFRNVPSYVHLRDAEVDVPGIGVVRFDIAYGGAYYAFVDAKSLDLSLEPRRVNELIDIGRRIKHAVMQSFPIAHPFEPDLGFLYGTIFTAPAVDPRNHSRNVCIFADGEVDRSATGSGVSARAALHHARGEIAVGETITIESIVGSTMTVSVAEQTVFGPYNAVIPEVGGTASITGRHVFYFDPADPFRAGFLVR